MKMFTTAVELPNFSKKMSLQSQILSFGSCFSDNIGKKLVQNKFQVLNNPFGTIFNPISIFNILSNSLNNTNFEQLKIIQNQEIWAHYDTHSKLSALSKNELEQNIQNAKNEVKNCFDKMTLNSDNNFLILTFGTAYVYQLKKTQNIVANCHKMPANLFEKRLLSVTEIVENFEQIYDYFKNKNISIILTISPIRHIKETLPNNNISKSILRLACHELTNKYEKVSYFPAYEMMLDELRDYRFYEADLIHPNEIAIQYIFEKFTEKIVTESGLEFMKKWQKIQAGLNHKPQFENTNSYQLFLNQLLKKVQNITEINTTSEIQQIEQKLMLFK